MKIERTDVDNLNAQITVTIEQADYEEKYKSTLQEHRKKTNIKGFRKGKTPLGFIKKLYGKALLADVVNETLQRAVVDYLVEQKIDFLGQPLPSEDQQPVDFDNAVEEDFKFTFDLGLAPEFELNIKEGKTFPKDEVEIPAKMVKDELDLLRRRTGNQTMATEDIRENDILLLSVKELENGIPKEEGHTHEFTIMVDLIADEKLKKEILKKKAGDTFTCNLFNLEKDKDEKHVRKYFLGLQEDDDTQFNEEFEAGITEVRRVEPAALDEDFFQKAFGNQEIKNEQEALDAIRKDIASHYERQADALLYRDVQTWLLEQHQPDLPDDFLKRWLRYNDEKLDSEDLEKNFDTFRKDLQWRLIKNKLGSKFEIKVGEEEIKAEALRRIINYLGAYQDEALLQSLQARILGDKEQVEKIAEEIEANKIFTTLVEQYKIKDKKISLDDFREKLNKFNEREE